MKNVLKLYTHLSANIKSKTTRANKNQQNVNKNLLSEPLTECFYVMLSKGH